MTVRNQNIVIIISVLAIFCVAFFMIFEIRQVPDVSWTQSYKYDSKEPYGAWTFQQLLYQSYGEENVNQYTDIDSFDTHNKQLYINYGQSITIPLKKQNQLFRFLENGNSILFIGENVNSTSDTLNNYDLDEIYYSDSLSRINFIHEDSTSYVFKFYNGDLEKTSEVTKAGAIIDEYSDTIFHSLAEVSDSLSVFYKRDHSNGAIYVYNVPGNFSNIAATQDDYLNHFNQVFSHFEARSIILDSPRQSDILQNQYADKSPLQYILSQPPLAWAYYLTALGVFLFILFRGKRRQRIIPITKINHNTSLEYVDTISQVFLSQKQNRKLVEHIESIFYHNVRKKYFLDRNHRDFEHMFIQKSKIDKSDVSYVLDKFKNAKDGYEFTDTQLHSLFKKLELIYSK